MRGKFAILLAIAAVCATSASAIWSPEAMVTGDDSTSRGFCFNNGHSVVFGPDGVGHVLWRFNNSRGTAGSIYSQMYNPLSGWTSDHQVSQTGAEPCVALDADGTTIHVMWNDTLVCYRKCARGVDGSDVWGPVVPVGAHADWPVMASVPNSPNHLVACWGRGFTLKGGKLSSAIAFVECVNGVWTPELRLDSAASATRLQPAVAVAPNGDVSIAYEGNSDHVYVKTRHNGIWGTTVDVTSSLGSNLCSNPAIEANPNTGNPHVVFTCRTVTQISKRVSDTTWAVYHAYRNSAGIWQTPRTISVPRHFGGYLSFWHSVTMAFVSNGSAYAVWGELYPATSRGVMYGYCSAEGGTWSTPAWISPDTSASYADRFPFVAVDAAAGAVRVVWRRCYTGVHEQIWWRNGDLGSNGPQAQPMALPQSGIEVFPNPAKAGRVTVQYSLPCNEPLSVTLLDVSGRVVRTQKVAADGLKGSLTVDVSGLNAGVYVARLVAKDLTVSKSLVVER